MLIDEDAQIHRVVTILESHHPLEMDESTEEPTAGTASAGGGAVHPSPTVGSAQAMPAAAGIPGVSAPGTEKEEVIPLVEENIEIGKRTVDRGTTRARRYVVECPVERDVTLHGERVTIERRRPADVAASGHAFEERIVEVKETEEVPVVEKDRASGGRRSNPEEETERTEAVRDNVRREEVEVTNENGQQQAIR